MITDCPVWLRRDFLLRQGLQPDEPPCTCDDCPPETDTPPAATAAEARRYPG